MHRKKINVFCSCETLNYTSLRPGETGQHCLSNISIWSLVTFVCQFRHNQIYLAKLASKHRPSNICLPTCNMCLPNMKCLENLVVAKRAIKDRLWNYLMSGKQCWSVSAGLYGVNVDKFLQIISYSKTTLNFNLLGS